jgi:regulatory protein
MKKNVSSAQEGKSLEYKQALEKAAAYCSRQEVCGSQVEEKLRAWNTREADVQKILDLLQKENFLDDGRYARFYARDKFRFNGWGRIKISHMLRQKRIAGSEIETALEAIDPEDYFQTCLDQIRNRSRSLKDKDDFVRRGKLFRFAAGRGFETEIIRRALDNLEEE